MKPDLKVVPKEPSVAPFDETRGIRRITILRNQLLAATVRYVREGKSGKPQDRIREASDWAGIPRTLIETALLKA